MIGTANACIGEVAGKVSFNVSAGSSQTQQMQVFNSCLNESVYFTTFGQVKPKANATTPTITTSPQNGTLAPRENTYINITVYMPANAVAGTAWSGAAAVEEATGSPAAGGGASLSVGVVKLFSITALPQIFNPLPYAIAGGIAIAIAIVGGAYYFLKVAKRPKAKQKPKKVDKVAMRLQKLEAKYAAEKERLLAQKRGAKRGAKRAARKQQPARGPKPAKKTAKRGAKRAPRR
ncbi:MAG: hypothetical protein KGH78_03755 [Candidatus Micrarchaeota archaeon]|nr:hypothetical protein [Candidatus Micrarchaeota archaeon]